MADDDLTAQTEELEALSAIYGDDFVTVDNSDHIYELRVCDETDSWWSATIQLLLPPEYPSKAPPVFEIHSEWMSEAEMSHVIESIHTVCSNFSGECMIYQMVEVLHEFVSAKSARNKEQSSAYKEECSGGDDISLTNDEIQDSLVAEDNLDQRLTELSLNHSSTRNFESTPEIFHGATLVDRRSTFQAHAAHTQSLEQVKVVLQNLNENKRIANATHNVMAYRIFCEDKNSYLQDCDDDGETAAGSRLLHLVQILNVKNVVVMVSRWYGGIKLGPDRFKHINNCARELLNASGFLDGIKENGKPPKNRNKMKSKKRKIKD